MADSNATVAHPGGLKWYQSSAINGSNLAIIAGAVGSVASAVAVFDPTGTAAAISGAAGVVAGSASTVDTTSLVGLITGLLGVVGGVIAWIGRYNGGKAASPIK